MNHVRKRYILLIPVILLVFSGCSRPQSPWLVRVEAWTFAESEQVRAHRELPLPVPPQKIRVCGKYIYLPSSNALSAATRAIDGPEGSAMVHIQIKPSSQYKSYKIYRSNDGTVYTLIGERPNDPSFYETAYYLDSEGEFQALWFNDLDSSLQVDQDYLYRIKGVTSVGEEDSGREYRVRILPKFTTTLNGPDNESIINLNTTPTPVFSWSVAGGFQDDPTYSYFLIYVLASKEDGFDSLPFAWLHSVYGDEIEWWGAQGNLASVPYGVRGSGEEQAKPLQYNATYEWDLAYACSAVMYMGMDFGESYAASFSYPRVTFGSSNGAFSFTITDNP